MKEEKRINRDVFKVFYPKVSTELRWCMLDYEGCWVEIEDQFDKSWDSKDPVMRKYITLDNDVMPIDANWRLYISTYGGQQLPCAKVNHTYSVVPNYVEDTPVLIDLVNKMSHTLIISKHGNSWVAVINDTASDAKETIGLALCDAVIKHGP